MYKIKLQILGAAIVCLTSIGVNMESVSSCNSLDLRAIVVHMQQTQTEYRKLHDMYAIDIANLRQELNNSASISKKKIEIIQSELNYTETETKYHLNSLQGQINKSRDDQESQRHRIETLREHTSVLQEQLNKSETNISELQFLMNASDTELKRQVERLYDIERRMDKTYELAERLMTSVEELNVTFQETKEQLKTLQDDFKREMNRTDGQWSVWSSWSTCSSSNCRQTRNRTCNNPAPSPNGHMCEGNSMDIDFCGLTVCQSEKRILFRATVGIGATFDTSEAWKTAGAGTTTDPVCRNVRRDGCTKHYRSTRIDDWIALNPHTIRYSIFKNESEVAWVMFNATGSTNTNWFSRDRVLSSNYKDLTDGASYNTFAIADPSSLLQRVDRHFYVNQDFGGCYNDNTWFATFDNTGNCFFDQYGGYPYIMYSKLSTHANTGTISNFGFGDCAVVSLID